ncbi:MAG: NADH-quinone oxidoreductase subunit I [Bdellovibrionales bacterium]|nr:NADH-quinone oxidoreductase subunit I [Bdellovibrionales bacterium]
MAIKTAPRPNLRWTDYLYLPSILKGLKITFSYFAKTLLRKNLYTMEFPEQKWMFPKRYRGYPMLVQGDNGVENCVACKLCEVVCPPSAITIRIGHYNNPEVKERIPAEFIIDMGRCIVCGMCEEACPCEAIVMSNAHVMSSGSRSGLIFKKTLLLDDYHQIPTMRD